MIEDEAFTKQLQIIEASNQAITQITNQTKGMLLNLRNFLNVCEEIRRQIIIMNNIPEREFYPPLENALLGNNVSLFLHISNHQVLRYYQ